MPQMMRSNRARLTRSVLLFGLALSLLNLAVKFAPPSDAAVNPQGSDCQQGIGGRLFSNGGQLEVEILPSDAGFTIELHLVSPGPDRLIATNREPGSITRLGTFPAGTELIFGAFVRETQKTFVMGPGAGNPDGLPHAEVTCFGGGRTNVGFEDQMGGGDRDYNDLLCTIRQANNCIYSVSPRSQGFDSTGGTGRVAVTPSSGCSWVGVSNASWIVITSGGSGSSSGMLNYSVATNTDAGSRTGTITIQDQTVAVNQDGAAALPLITSTIRSGKKLFIYGINFDNGSVILLNGEPQTTRYDADNPTTVLIGKKTGKRVQPGDKLRVQKSSGALSQEYTYTP